MYITSHNLVKNTLHIQGDTSIYNKVALVTSSLIYFSGHPLTICFTILVHTYRIVLPQSFPNRKSYNTPKSNAFVQRFRPCPRGLSLHAVAWHLYLYLRLSPRPRENLWACRSRGGAREPVPRRRRSARSTSPSSERRRGPSTRRGGRLGTTTRAR